MLRKFVIQFTVDYEYACLPVVEDFHKPSACFRPLLTANVEVRRSTSRSGMGHYEAKSKTASPECHYGTTRRCERLKKIEKQ